MPSSPFSRLSWILGLLLLGAVLAIAAAVEDYYKVLGIPRSADEKAIRTAYRRKSKQWHPDKHSGSEEAQKRFVEISQAYEVLSDDEKRGIYDKYGHEGLKQHEQSGGRGGGGGFHDPFDLFSQFFGGRHGGHGHQQVRKGPNMVMEMEVDLADVYSGKSFTIDLQRKSICESCEGSGARSPKDVVECNVCGGRGVRILKHMLAPGMYQQVQMQCDKCGGRGKTIKHVCPKCSGHRIVDSETDISIDIDRGIPEGIELTFEGEADESPDWVPGDLVVRVRSKAALGGFTRRMENLYWRETISVQEALLGFEHTIQHLDGHVIKLSSKEGETIQPGQVQVFHGEGMPRYHSSDYGDLFVEYNIVMPRSVSAQAQKKLRDAFQYRPAPRKEHKEL